MFLISGLTTGSSPSHRLLPQQCQRQHDLQLRPGEEQRQLHQEGRRRRLDEPLHARNHSLVVRVGREGDGRHGHPHHHEQLVQNRIQSQETNTKLNYVITMPNVFYSFLPMFLKLFFVHVSFRFCSLS